jgi:hypothetical protein
MPYIKPARRPSLDPIIDGLIKRLKEIDCVKGDVNYAVTRIAVECLNEHGYHSISDCISVLRDAADEIRLGVLPNELRLLPAGVRPRATVRAVGGR